MGREGENNMGWQWVTLGVGAARWTESVMILSTKPTQWPDAMTYCTATELIPVRCFSTSGSRLACQLSNRQFCNFALRRCQ